jgi:hypothetical protein
MSDEKIDYTKICICGHDKKQHVIGVGGCLHDFPALCPCKEFDPVMKPPSRGLLR